jgi:hypothetical protein
MDDWEMSYLQESSHRRQRRKRQDLLKVIVLLALIGAIATAVMAVFEMMVQRAA